jgi:uncharacterized membrane protein (UPF0136 family)
MEIWESMIIGATSGLFMAGSGYFKSYNQNSQEGFKLEKFGSTVVLGAIVGGVAGSTGMAPEIIIALPIYAAVTTFVENAVKGIIRHFQKKP